MSKAKDYIDRNTFTYNSMFKNLVTKEMAIDAVNISEQEMKEKAIEAFKTAYCTCSDFTKCSSFNLNIYECECDAIKDFKEQLNK
jgi:hypothetical protein